MKVIKKVWVRILLSLFVGGMFAEIMHIRTGDASVETSNKYVYVMGFVTYLVLTGFIWFSNYLKYWKGSKTVVNDDILDG